MEEAAQWYALLISDDARPGDHVRWQAWLQAAPGHRQAWDYVEHVSQQFLAPLRDTPNPRLTSDNLQAATQRVLRRRRVLASLGLLTTAGLVGGLRWREASEQIAVWTADHRTGTGEIRALRLTDGSDVWLNTASAFNEDFRLSLRRLHLTRGEILVQTHADQRPFVVDTPHGRLRALGTRFTVWTEGQESFVAVYEGAVELQPARLPAATLIAAGRQRRFTALSVGAEQAADPARQAWRQGDLIAVDLSLQEVVATLRRYTHAHIGVDPEVAQRRVFGTFPLHDVPAALSLLAQAGHATLRRPLPWWTTLSL